MTVLQPTWIQGESYTGTDLRLAETAAFGAPSTTLARPGGVIPGFGGALAVTLVSGTTVSIASGAAQVAHASGSGSYRFINDAALTRALTTVSAGQTRVDLILARVDDTGTPETSGGDIVVHAGTIGAGVPSMPAGVHAVKLAEVTVTSTGISAIADRRTWTAAAGGVLPCTSTTRPANPYNGLAIFETDTNQAAFYNAGAWRTVPTGSSGTWTAYTPAWTVPGGSQQPVNGTNGTLTGRYLRSGQTVQFTVNLVISGVGLVKGTGGSNGYALSLPPSLPAGPGSYLVNAYWMDNSATIVSRKHWVGVAHLVNGATTTGAVYLAVGDPTATDDADKGGVWSQTAPAGGPATGDTMTISGFYETTA